MVKWLMTGPFSQLKQKTAAATGGAGRGEITYRETKGFEQFPKDKRELEKK